MPSTKQPLSRSRRERQKGALELHRDGRGRRKPEVSDWDRLPPGSRAEMEEFVALLLAVKGGDFTARFSPRPGGILSRSGEVLNDILALAEHLSTELSRVGRVVGHEGRMTERASVGPAKGAWATTVNAVNQLIGDLVAPTNEVARVITAVAQGDLSQKMSLEIEGRPVRGEFLRIGTTVNSMVDQLNSFAAEVTRVAKEVGTEGKLGGQAEVQGRLRHLEGPDRQRQRPGRQPDRAGAQHRQGDDRRRQRRPVAEDHGRREGRDPRAQEHDQHHGRSAPLVRGRGDARREGGRHRRQARRPGRGERRLRHLEGPDRQRQRPGRATSPTRCATSPRSRPPSPTATCRRRSPSTRAARSSS